jgi:outer membrane murein-binding lipoprotein Lpp
MRMQSIAIAVSCAALLATGCATSGKVDKLEDRVGTLEQRLGDVERKAAAAQSSAEQAAADARIAAQNTERSEAMFKKTVQK